MIIFWLALLHLEVIARAEACGARLTGSGTVYSPNFPHPYPDNASCQWYLTAKSGGRVRLQFLSFSLEDLFDSLVVYNITGAVQGGKLATFTGYEQPKVVTGSSEVLLNFSSDGSVAYSGFNIYFSSLNMEQPNDPAISSEDLCNRQGRFFCNVSHICVDPSVRCNGLADCAYGDDEHECADKHFPIGGCGGSLSGSGIIASPSYPLPYPSNSDCSWSLVAFDGHVIHLGVLSLWVESYLDQLNVYQGQTSATEKFSHMYTGFKAAPDILVLDRYASIKFKSDESVNFAGFLIVFASLSRSSATSVVERIESLTSSAFTTPAWEGEVVSSSFALSSASTWSSHGNCTSPDAFWCEASEKCIRSQDHCNGVSDCYYLEDEWDCQLVSLSGATSEKSALRIAPKSGAANYWLAHRSWTAGPVVAFALGRTTCHAK